MPLALKLTAAPQTEPMTIADPVVKQHLRIIDMAEDALVSLILSKAREAAEQITRRALITQSWLMTLDQFPNPRLETSSANWYGPSWGVGPGPLTSTRPEGVTQTEIYVPLPPLQTVDSIKYYDVNGTLQTLASNAYIVDSVTEPGRIVPAVGTAWPSTQNRINAVEVRFTCGYGATGASVPSGIRNWILMMTGTLYENRELMAVIQRGSVEELPMFGALLDAYRVVKF